VNDPDFTMKPPSEEVRALTCRLRRQDPRRSRAKEALREREERSRRLEELLLQSQKMEGIGRLASRIAHDFNTLLCAILGFAELAEEDLPPDSPVQAHLHSISKAADRAVGLNRQLMAFSREQDRAPRVVSMNDLILDVESLLRHLIGEHIALVTVLEENPWRIKIDAGQYDQILVNLVVNARDAMPDGGTLTLETTNVVLDHETATRFAMTPGDYVLLTVRDTGAGMAATIQQHIFKPFFTTKASGKGTGLGMAICSDIIKLHGGHIQFESALGEGTTFQIYLPRVHEEQERRAV
jgi:two-component system cell cycle sensor histidine kinase/response regulator CckA